MTSGSHTAPLFDNSYARLPPEFYTRLDPTPVAEPRLVAFQHELAAELGLADAFDGDEHRARVFGGNETLPGMEPLAAVYAGHQFGGFVPQLGDGRAILLGEVVDDDGRRFDIQLKGAGRTPYSRNGDGRAALGPVLREYLVSEAMHALGVPTTRALAAVTTGEPVFRERPLPGAVITRVASSHIRVGTFQYFAARGEHESVRLLIEHVAARHDPDITDAEAPALELLRRVAERQAALVARWMGVGFVHGVMNTDNTSIAGETIDYGPCAFLDYYDPEACFSSIDRYKRYAFQNQAPIALWNLTRLAECLLPHIDSDSDRAVERATEVLRGYQPEFERQQLAVFGAKLGLREPVDSDAELIEELWAAMQKGRADFTRTFRALADRARDPDAEQGLCDLFETPDEIAAWLSKYDARLRVEHDPRAIRADRMQAVNPICIPRNHLVEEALQAAVEEDDLGPFFELLAVVTRPFEASSDRYAAAGKDDQNCYRTFCGT